jgi:hypothetical protein
MQFNRYVYTEAGAAESVVLSFRPSAQEVLVGSLEAALTRFYGSPRSVVRLARRISPYSTSFTLEELDVKLDDGARLSLICKNLGSASLLPEARRVRPDFLYAPLREIQMYERVLDSGEMGTAAFYGASCDAESDRYLLFLERVPSAKLCHVGDFAVWTHVARWLGVFHSRMSTRAAALRDEVPLLEYDQAFYQRWVDRAKGHLEGNNAPLAARRDIAWIGSRYAKVARELARLPRTIIHGEFYASNVLMQRLDGNSEGSTHCRVCPVDWEMAAYAPGLIDLAALVSGRWTADQREAMAREYYHAASVSGDAPRLSWEDLLRALEYCRLHLAVQWVGWSADWSPPDDQARDWLREAVAVARGLGW